MSESEAGKVVFGAPISVGGSARASNWPSSRQSGGYWQDGKYFAADLAYTPGASFDLLNWGAGIVQVPSLLNLPPAPVGYEWTSYQVPGATNQGFGRVKVELR